MMRKLMLVSVLLMFFLGQLPTNTVADTIVKANPNRNEQILNTVDSNELSDTSETSEIVQETGEEADTAQTPEKTTEEMKDTHQVKEELEDMHSEKMQESDGNTIGDEPSEIIGSEDSSLEEVSNQESKNISVLDENGKQVEYSRWYYLGAGSFDVSFRTGNHDVRLSANSRKRVRLIPIEVVSLRYVTYGDTFRVHIQTDSSDSAGVPWKINRWTDGIDYITYGNSAPGTSGLFRLVQANNNSRKVYINYVNAVSGGRPGTHYVGGAMNELASVLLRPNISGAVEFGFYQSLSIRNVEGGSITADETVDRNESTTIRAVPDNGYSFGRWETRPLLGNGVVSIANSNNSMTTLMPLLGSRSNELSATFTRNTYSLNTGIMPGNGGTVRVNATNIVYGSTTNITATPNAGYRFVRWEIVGSGSSVANQTSASTTFTMGIGNATATAVFAENSYSLNTDVKPSNSGSVKTDVMNMNYGSTTNITATPNEGHRFVRWEIVGSGSSVENSTDTTTTFRMGTENATVTAIFEPIPTILELKELKNADFDFGSIKKSSHAQTLAAKGESAPSVTISDYSESNSWELRVSQPEGLKDAQKNELSGAVIRLKNNQVVDSVHENILLPARNIELSSVQRSVARMVDHGGEKETGLTILKIGDSKDQTLSGIEMSIPRNTISNASTYQTTIEWELTGDPTLTEAEQIGGQDEAS